MLTQDTDTFLQNESMDAIGLHQNLIYTREERKNKGIKQDKITQYE